MRVLLDDAFEVLSERDREVLRLRFAEDLTQTEISRARRRLADAGVADHPPGAAHAARRTSSARRSAATRRRAGVAVVATASVRDSIAATAQVCQYTRDALTARRG